MNLFPTAAANMPLDATAFCSAYLYSSAPYQSPLCLFARATLHFHAKRHMQRLLCVRCGDSIHPETAARNAGLCMPCVHGNQLSIEARRAQHDRQREAERARLVSPEYRYWLGLIDRVYKTEAGFDSLSHGDRLYYLVNVLSGEVHNGGFDQFFSNSSGDRCAETIAALSEVGAHASLKLLQQAKHALFADEDVPVDRMIRYKLMRTSSEAHPDFKRASSTLDELDSEFYKDPDSLGDILEQIAAKHKLYTDDA